MILPILETKAKILHKFGSFLGFLSEIKLSLG